MPVLPIREVTPPAVLKGQPNGQLPDSILVNIPCLYGGPTIRLVAPAARAFIALRAAAAVDGHLLKCSGTYSSYRPKWVQDQLFRERFRPYDTGRRPAVTRTFEGKTWWLLPGVALAAVPGTSNHGKGIAIDVGEERDGDSGTESLDDGTLAWLAANALRLGWSWEVVPEEPWHLRYFTGDAIPAAVLAYEEDNMPWQLRSDPDFRALIERVENMHNLDDFIPPDSPNKTERAPIVAAIKDIQARLAALEAKPVPPGSVDLAPVLAALAKVQATVDRLVASEKAQAQALG